MTDSNEIKLARLESRFEAIAEKLEELKELVIMQSCYHEKCDERFVRRGEVKLVWLAVMAVAGFFGWKIGG